MLRIKPSAPLDWSYQFYEKVFRKRNQILNEFCRIDSVCRDWGLIHSFLGPPIIGGTGGQSHLYWEGGSQSHLFQARLSQSRIRTDQIICNHFGGAGGGSRVKKGKGKTKGKKERRVGRKERELKGQSHPYWSVPPILGGWVPVPPILEGPRKLWSDSLSKRTVPLFVMRQFMICPGCVLPGMLEIFTDEFGNEVGPWK